MVMMLRIRTSQHIISAATRDRAAHVQQYVPVQHDSSATQVIVSPNMSSNKRKRKRNQSTCTIFIILLCSAAGLASYISRINGSLHVAVNVAVDPSPSLLKKIVPGRNDLALACGVEGPIDKQSYEVIQKIRRGIILNQKKLKSKSMNEARPRILCLVYTHEGAHSTLQVLVNTWATQCDGFIAASNATDPSIGAFDLKHDGPEAYGNMWQKVRSMWKYANDHFLDDYDYFHICGDDSYILLDNLRLYLMGDQVKKLLNGSIDNISRLQENSKRWKIERPRPLILGYPVQYVRGKFFAAGGSGYTLNRAAVKLLVDTHGPSDNDAVSTEDVYVSKILSTSGVHVADTRDEDGAFRYIPDNPVTEWNGRHPFAAKSGIKDLLGIDAFSTETVAMHLNYRKKSAVLHRKKLVKNMSYNTDEILHRFHDFFIGRCDEQLLGWQGAEEKMEESTSTVGTVDYALQSYLKKSKSDR